MDSVIGDVLLPSLSVYIKGNAESVATGVILTVGKKKDNVFSGYLWKLRLFFS